MYSFTYKLLTQSGIRSVMLPDREHNFSTHILLVMQWDDCLAVKWAIRLLAVSIGMGWDEPVQHNTSRAHPLGHEIRYYLDTQIVTPLTFYLLWDKMRLSGGKKCSNTYILSKMGWCIRCNKTLCQKHADQLLVWDEIWWTALGKVQFHSLPVAHAIRCNVIS